MVPEDPDPSDWGSRPLLCSVLLSQLSRRMARAPDVLQPSGNLGQAGGLARGSQERTGQGGLMGGFQNNWETGVSA